MKDSIKDLQSLVIKFRDQRNWKQYHNPKDFAISLVLEAAELIEHFQWKSPEELEAYVKNNKEKIGEEIADVLYVLLIMSYDFGIDIEKTFRKKMKQNAKKYPVRKSKGLNKKYTEL